MTFNKNKILMISPVNPFPPNSGGKVRIYYTFLELSKYYDVRLMVPLRSKESIPAPFIDNVQGINVKTITKTHKLVSLLSLHPYHQVYWFSKEFKKAIHEEMNKNNYSLIYCHFFYTYPYVKGVSLPIVIDAQNVDDLYWRNKAIHFRNKKEYFHSIFSTLNALKIDCFEKRIIPNVKKVIEVSDQDANYFQKKYKVEKNKVIVIPNGVDLQSYKFMSHSFALSDSATLTLGFLGSLNVALNQEAAIFMCNKILPKLEKRHPNLDIKVMIIGKEPPRSLVDIAEMSDGKIQLTGTVEKIPPYLEKIDILILPLFHGAGTKLRVLEAMACGVVCVGTTLAFNGIDEINDQENALFAETDEQFIKKIEWLFNKSYYQRLAKAANNVVNSLYGWSKIGLDLKSFITALLIEDTLK